jgi:transglutaminase-like putative cysteine protease
MQRYKILHRTCYNFSAAVRLDPHTLLIRPREGHELRIESSILKITPPATLRWHRDVEDNSVAIATFDSLTSQLLIESEVIIQQYNRAPLDFLVADYAMNYPFSYTPEDRVVLAPYMNLAMRNSGDTLDQWLANSWRLDDQIQTYALLQRISTQICNGLSYLRREEPLGLAARFVSGYHHAPPSTVDFGATHAWAEVYLPGAGWKGFDPTLDEVAGTNHIAVAVAKLPESVPPIAGSFFGAATASLDVGVWVTELS